MVLSSPKKQEIIKNFQKNPQDCGSSDVQIAVLTERIKDLTEHLKTHPKDYSSRRGLLMMVGKRAALLQHLKKKHEATYKKLIDRLGIRK